MDNTARNTEATKPAVAKTNPMSPEAFAARFATIKSSAVFTNACAPALKMRWDAAEVRVQGGFETLLGSTPWGAFIDTLESLIAESIDNHNESRTALYTSILSAAVSLSKDVADWHNHCDDDSSPSFLDAAQEIGVSR